MIVERVETVVLARVATSSRAFSGADIAKQLFRFAPTRLDENTWREHVSKIVDDLQARELFDDRTEISRRIGKHAAKTWQQYAERYLPGLSLGIDADDSKSHGRLSGRDAWAAAIVARALGIWTAGPPPSLTTVCDAYAWQQLGLPGKPKRCPPEIRALFLQRELGVDAAPPDRVVRLYAATRVGAPRPELRALRDALVRNWIEGNGLAPRFAEEVRGVARATKQGVFGDRKVFISSVWNELRRQPLYSSLTLEDFKSRLVDAHRAGDVVLARADLVAAMNPDLVAASETTTDGASFHFIVREAT